MAARRLLLNQIIPRTPTLAFASTGTPSILPSITATQARQLTQVRHQRPHAAPSNPGSSLSQPRRHTYSTDPPAPATPKLYDFAAIKSLSESPSPERILIDVREPAEYADGFIPTAINLPIKSAPEALLLPADEFEDRFGFAKPSAAHEVVFYCRSGVRSGAAAKLAEQAGYQNIAEYKGSWMDWAAQGGKVGR